jgi:hypothetical protein
MSVQELGPYGRPVRPASSVAAPQAAAPQVAAAPVQRAVPAPAPTPSPGPAEKPGPAATVSATITLDRRTVVGLGIVAATVVGCMAPWVSLGILSSSGLDLGGDALIALAAGVLGGVLLVGGRSRIVIGVLGAVLIAIAVLDGIDIGNRGNEFLSPSVGWGLYLIGLVGATLVLSSLMRMRRSRPLDSPSTPS